ncbi:hypothetical protein JQ621_24810 [Bradyrhizobium manausense]|uniref:hypothetical protein n=1 Tax=Bradyrhizobium manausense TaxID=989370 RepID=UPI001BA6C2EA|nr:hypothetical protein [Bradyrhizobium manausense]MBR1090701.1 hypothetical protein [Bradyrhizobium manausense]
MRLTVIFLLGLLATAAAGRAQNVDPDGFSICALTRAGVLGPCQPLTEQAMRGFGLSTNQIAIIARLRDFAANPGLDPRPHLVNESLLEPKAFAAVGAFSDTWFADAANPGKVDLGVHLRYVTEDAGPQLFQMTYAADAGHFSVLWNRALVSQHR